MYQHILIAVDGSDVSVRAEEQGFALAKALGSQVTLVHSTEPWPTAVSGEWALAMPLKEYQELATANAKNVLTGAAERAGRYGVACKTVHIPDRYAADGIIEHAKATPCDLIVMGSHGRRGLSKLLLGSEATRVLTGAPVPVLICR
jgi:nucleotide-binding universal stress UspA family protein